MRHGSLTEGYMISQLSHENDKFNKKPILKMETIPFLIVLCQVSSTWCPTLMPQPIDRLDHSTERDRCKSERETYN